MLKLAIVCILQFFVIITNMVLVTMVRGNSGSVLDTLSARTHEFQVT